MNEGIEDDASVPDEQRFLRRIWPTWIHDFRPERSNFEIREPHAGLSVTAWLSQADLVITIAEAPNCGVVSVTARQLRDAGYVICKVPLEQNPNHCECYGKPSKSARKQLAISSQWVSVPPEHVAEYYGDLVDF